MCKRFSVPAFRWVSTATAFSFLPFAALSWQQLFFSLPFAAFPRCWIASFPLPFVKADEERCCDLAELKIRKW